MVAGEYDSKFKAAPRLPGVFREGNQPEIRRAGLRGVFRDYDSIGQSCSEASNGPLLYPHHGSSAISQALWRMIILSAITRSAAISGTGSRRISGAICGKKRIQTVTPLQMPMAWALLG